MQKQKLEAARVAALFNVARPAYFATLAIAGLLMLVLWEAFPVALLLAWFGILAAVTAARSGLHRAYARDPGQRAPQRWETLFTIGAIAAGAIWAYPPAVFLPLADPLLQMAVIFVVGGTIIGAAGVYAPSPAAFYGFCALPFAAVVAQLAAQAGRTYALLAFTVAVFGVVMVRVYRDIHGAILRSLRTRDAYDHAVAEGKLVLDMLPVGVAFMADRVITRANRQLENMLGYGAGELNGQSSRILYPSEEIWREAGERYRHLRGGGVLDGEFKLRRKDGTALWCRAVGRAMEAESPAASVIITYSDTSERHAAERALRKSEAMHRNLVETSNDLIWSVDAGARWTYLSPAAARRIYGCEPADMLGREFREQIAQEVSERDLAVFRRILEGESVFDYETRHVRRDGGYIDLQFNAVPTRDARGAVSGATGTARDVTAQKAAAAALYENVEKLRLAVDAAELEYWEWDRASGAMHFGRAPGAPQPAAKRISFDAWLQRVHPDDRERCRDASLATQQRGEPYQIDFRIHHPAGEERWMHSRGKAIMDTKGEIARVIGVSQDITDRKRQEEEARYLAYHDTLTALPNRRLLDDRLQQAVFLAQRRDARVGLMLVDLDHFKEVNDALGHHAGDTVLREAAQRIAACLRKADTLARHGGDEFVVVIPDTQLDADLQVVAEKILRALEPPFRVEGRDFLIGASIGVSLYPGDGGDGESLLRNADVAMYRAKQHGRNNYRFFGN